MRPGLRKFSQVAAALLYYWLLCWIDRTVLAPLFGYQGLAYRPATHWTQAGVVGLTILCAALTPVRIRQPSDGVLYVLLPLVVIPVFAVAATDPDFANVAGELILAIGGSYVLLALCSMLPRRPSNPLRFLALGQPWPIAILLSVASYGVMFATFGLHFRLLSFSDVYGARAAFDEQAGGATSYLLDWQANVINPMFIVFGIGSRRALPIAAGVLGDVLIYSTTGFKSVLFSALAIVALLAAMHQRKPGAKVPAAGMRLGFAFVALAAFAYVVDKVGHTIIWTSLFVRRLSLVAGVNTGYYFQYFGVEPKTHLAYGLVGKFMGSGGVVPPPQQIAIAAYNSSGDPNANLWADAYANFGYAGVVGFTLLLAAFLWFYDRVAQHVDRRAAAVLLVVPALTLANSALLTCLFTHGLLLALLVITQWPRLVPTAEGADVRAGRGRLVSAA
jgi:hypothetical protein